jgi:uncharacterized protein
MPHKCVQCGREYKEGAPEILQGCVSCGGRKFFFTRESERNEDVLFEKTTEDIIRENEAEVLEVEAASGKKAGSCERVESIRIVSPGTYELNIEKLATSDDRVVGIGPEGNYIVDLHSMMKPKKGKKEKR